MVEATSAATRSRSPFVTPRTQSHVALWTADRILTRKSIAKKGRRSSEGLLADEEGCTAPFSARQKAFQPASVFRTARQQISDDVRKTEPQGARPASFFRAARQRASGGTACETPTCFSDDSQHLSDDSGLAEPDDRPRSVPPLTWQSVSEQIFERAIEEETDQQEKEHRETQRKVDVLRERCRHYAAMNRQEELKHQATQSKMAILEERCQKLEAYQKGLLHELDSLRAECRNWRQSWMWSEEEKIELQKELDTSKQAVKERSNKGLCVVCLDQQASHAVLPCGHLAFCGNCSTELEVDQCPVCRQEGTGQLLQIFHP